MQMGLLFIKWYRQLVLKIMRVTDALFECHDRYCGSFVGCVFVALTDDHKLNLIVILLLQLS